MSFLSSLFFRLFTFLLFFMVTGLQANAHSLTKKACDLAQRGHLFLKPYLEAEDLEPYANELQFIKNFPFSSYKLITVHSQGKFFINDINDTIKNRLRKGECWESKNKFLISKYATPGSTALDIGAHWHAHCHNGKMRR